MTKTIARCKKTIALATLLGSLSTATLSPAPSHAVVGVSIANPALAIVGAGVLVTALPLTVLGISLSCGGPQRYCLAFSLLRGIPIGGAIAVLGLILLEDASPTLAYTSLSDDQATLLGLTRAEQNTFNNQVEELNSVRESVAQNVNSALQKNSVATLKELHEISRFEWKNAVEQNGDPEFQLAVSIAQRLGDRLADFASR